MSKETIMQERVLLRSRMKKIGNEQLRYALVQKSNGYFDILDDYGTFMYSSRTCSTQDINEAIKLFENISGDRLTDKLKQILCNI